MGKIATERDAYEIGGIGTVTEWGKCCTRTRAEQLGCEVTNDYDNNQLVQIDDLSLPEIEIPIRIYHFNGYGQSLQNNIIQDNEPSLLAATDYVEIESELETKTINGLYNGDITSQGSLMIRIPAKNNTMVNINVHKTSGNRYASSLEAYSIGEFMTYTGGSISQQFSAIQWEQYGAFSTYFMRWIYTTPIISFWANIPVKIVDNYQTEKAKEPVGGIRLIKVLCIKSCAYY